MLDPKDNLRYFRKALQKFKQLTVEYEEMVNFDSLVKTASRVWCIISESITYRVYGD